MKLVHLVGFITKKCGLERLKSDYVKRWASEYWEKKKVLSCKGYFLGGARFYIFHDSDSVTRVKRFHSLSLVQCNTDCRSNLECS